jgi:toxin ParE1/3/4
VSDVPFLPAAEEEFLDAVARYEAARNGLGGEFLAEVERATRRIAFFPKHGSPYFAGTRRIVLRRFPYSVVYDADELLVVAVAHQRRLPGYWRYRIQELERTKGSTDSLSAEALLQFASTLERHPLVTLSRAAGFHARTTPAGLEITPSSTQRARLIPPAVIQRVCEEYLRSGSTRPGDYQDITFDASYLLAVIDQFLRQLRA